MRLILLLLWMVHGMANPTQQQTPDELAKLDIAAGWPLNQVAQAVAVQLSESGGTPNEIGWDYQGRTVADTSGLTEAPQPWSSYDTGLFQINSSSNPNNAADVYDPTWIANMENPQLNIAQGLAMWKARGWEPWSGDAAISSGANYGIGQQAVADVTGKTGVSVPGTLPSGGPSGSVSASAAGSGGPAQKNGNTKLSGVAGVLQTIDGLLNPASPGLVSQITSLGLSNSATVVEQWVVRLLFALGFMGVTYLGVKTLTGTSGGGTNIINIAERRREATTAQQNAATRAADVARKSQPGYGTTTRHNIDETRITKRTDVHHHRATQAAKTAAEV